MLRKIRIGISVVLFALITFYFLDFANILPNSFHRLAHIQFVPAVLSLSIGILIVLGDEKLAASCTAKYCEE